MAARAVPHRRRRTAVFRPGTVPFDAGAAHGAQERLEGWKVMPLLRFFRTIAAAITLSHDGVHTWSLLQMPDAVGCTWLPAGSCVLSGFHVRPWP